MYINPNVYAACTVGRMIKRKGIPKKCQGTYYDCLFSTLAKPYIEASEDVGVLSPQGEAEGCVMYGALSEPDAISNDNVQRILILLFLETGCKKSSTVKYWIMLLEAIQILLECIKAERTGNWKAHLVS